MSDQTKAPYNEMMQGDFARHLGAVTRSVTEVTRDGKPARSVTLERTYDTTPEDLWSAVTNPERLPRWFLPISGDLRRGGRFQLEGNAGGTITECEPPRFLATTWEFGDSVNWLEVSIHQETGGAALTLAHICPIDDHWHKYGPAAVGIGWDLGLLALGLHLSNEDGPDRFDEEAFAATPEGKSTMVDLSENWRKAAIASGDDPALADEAARMTAAFYIGS